MENGKLCGAVSLDLSKAFDTVDHEILLKKLQWVGVSDFDLQWFESHIEKISGKINKRLGLLKRTKHLLPRNARLLLYNSLVLPIFDYADLIWGDKGNDTLMAKLQILQNKAAKLILDRPWFSSATSALHELGWKPLSNRRFYHCCLYVFKCLNNLVDYDVNFLYLETFIIITPESRTN